MRVVDCMPVTEAEAPQLIRLVEGLEGTVTMRSEVLVRPDYGRTLPWLKPAGRRLRIFAGPDAVVLDGDVSHVLDGPVADARAAAEFTVVAGEQIGLRLVWPGWRRSYRRCPR